MAAQTRRDGGQAKRPVRDDLVGALPDLDRACSGTHDEVAGGASP